ncbi:MAG: UbiA prenyltransferase family protein [Candidatus Aenigmarchaeota archaeon]|nr:UbiA prenyltransferase family protein [Candidatus Aenigmarchaeota archaeon]
MLLLDQAKMAASSFYCGNALKNISQFSVMAALFYFYNGAFSFSDYLTGLVGFLLAYNFIYALNDTMNYDKDVKDREKRIFKKDSMKSPLHTGSLTKRELLAGSSALMSVGLVICYLVNPAFFLMVSLAIAANFLHSSGVFGIGKMMPLMAANFMLMQTMKFGSVWFTQTEIFDYRLVLPTIYMSVLYTMLYLGYKVGLGKKLAANPKSLLIMIGVIMMPLVAMLSQQEVLPFFALNLALTIVMFLGIVKIWGGQKGFKLHSVFMPAFHLNMAILISVIVAYGYMMHV